ncbi:MAG: protein kinase [Myxococcales bacterium]|nr:protein kinase [Myxococcales bacterium]
MHSLEAGAEFGPYTLIRRLATGGMGEIWLAEQRGISGFRKRVVIKTILECFSDDAALVDMFLGEGKIAAGFTHPNIAQTYDLGCIEGTYYIAMEFVNGRDLRELLLANIDRRRFIPLNLVLRIVAECCQGLQYAHTWKTPDGQPAGIVHRDISPQNILVTFEGAVKIVDFGIAKATHMASKTRSGVLKGKYAYMAPEQVRGREIDGRVDIFSLGVVMYEMVTARRLFKRNSEMATLDAVLQCEVPPPRRLDEKIPREVEGLVMRAVAREPEQRFQTALEMQLAVEQVMLECALPASLAHVAAYMGEMFGGAESERRTGAGGTERRMSQLPGVREPSVALERTAAYAPGLDLPSPDRGGGDTRNLLVSRSRPAPVEKTTTPVTGSRSVPPPPRTSRRRRALVLSTVALLVVAASGFLAVSYLLEPGRGDLDAGPSVAPPAQEPGTSMVNPPDAGSPEPGAEPGVPATPDGGSVALRADTERPMPPPPETRLAYLSLTTSPPSEIHLGKRLLGTGSVQRVPLPAGRQQLKVVARPGTSRTLSLNLAPGQHLVKQVAFEEGKLRVVVEPWAEVHVDGKFVDKTPMRAIPLLEGFHQVRLVNGPLGKDVTETVNIPPGQTITISKDWR